MNKLYRYLKSRDEQIRTLKDLLQATLEDKCLDKLVRLYMAGDWSCLDEQEGILGVMIQWSLIVQPSDLEKRFNEHEIMELLLEGNE